MGVGLEAKLDKRGNLVIFTIVFITSFFSIIYELLLINEVGSLTSSKILATSLCLAFYLMGMSLGASREEHTNAGAWAKLIRVEILLSLVGALSVPILQACKCILSIIFLESAFNPGFWIPANFLSLYALTGWQLFLSFFPCFIIGYLSGKELPLALIITSQRPKNSNHDHVLLGINYFGTLFGTLIFSLVLTKFFENVTIGFLASFCNLAIGGFILILRKDQEQDNPIRTFYCGLIVLPLLGLFSPIFIKGVNNLSFNFIDYYYQKESSPLFVRIKKAILENEYQTYPSLYQKIQSTYKDKKLKLFLDKKLQFVSAFNHGYHEALAHYPITVFKKVPKKILLLGGGDGLLLLELLKHREVEKIINVELDPGMIAFSKNDPYMSQENNFSYRDPRVQVIFQDAFRFIADNHEKFDAIYMDFPHPKDFNLSKLYSVEFYNLVHKALAPRGYAVQNVVMGKKFDSLLGYSYRNNSIFMSTALYSKFSNVRVFMMFGESFLLFSNERIIFPKNLLHIPKIKFYTSFHREVYFSLRASREITYETKTQYVNSLTRPIQYDPLYLTYEVF